MGSEITHKKGEAMETKVRRHWMRLVVAAAAVAMLGIASTQTLALNPQPEPPIFMSGLFAITPKQTARLNLATIAGPSQPGFRVMVRFLDPTGKELLARRLTLLPGKTAFVDFQPDMAKAATSPGTGQRLPLQAEVQVLSGSNPRQQLVPTLEIFTTVTGETTLLLPLLNPQPEPPKPDTLPR